MLSNWLAQATDESVICPVMDCDAMMPAHFVVCPAHWARVPHWLRVKLFENYTRGQDRDERRQTAAFRLAQFEATILVSIFVGAVTRAEGEAWIREEYELNEMRQARRRGPLGGHKRRKR